MQLSQTDINNIVAAANTLFDTPAFLEYPVPDHIVSPPHFTITAEVNHIARVIPVVSEWTYATDDILVFNTLNSCLGLIGTNNPQRPADILGIHLSMYNATDIAITSSGSVTAYYDLVNGILIPEGFDGTVSFGGSQNEWDDDHGVIRFPDLLAVYPSIADDENNRKWIFYLDDNRVLQSYKF